MKITIHLAVTLSHVSTQSRNGRLFTLNEFPKKEFEVFCYCNSWILLIIIYHVSYNIFTLIVATTFYHISIDSLLGLKLKLVH